MKISLENNSIRHTGWLIIAAHAVLFAIQLPQVYLFGSQSPQSGGVGLALVRLAWGCCISALITPLILLLGYYFRIGGRHLRRNLFLHLSFVILTGAVQHLGYSLGLWTFGLMTTEAFLSSVFNLSYLFNFISTSFLRNTAIIGIQQAYFFFRESQERAFNLQQAELRLLKMQLHPHFFFNTLNAVSALMYRSPKEADRLIVRLGDMFRIALRKDKTQEVPLREELEFLQAFLHIHQTLMGKRLRTEWEIEPETLDALVPNLILQPLVENAVQHGLAPLEAGGRIKISAARQNGSLLLRVLDDGQGFAPASADQKSDGIGLSNTRARLENLYAGAHEFSIYEPADGGTGVAIEIPFREPSTQEK